MNKPTSIAIGAVAAGAVAHTLPAISAVPFIRKTVMRELSGAGDPSHIAITFDDGPDPASTPQILEELERLGVKATFFMLGSMVERSRSLAREMYDAGHEIGLHGYEHRNHLFRTGLWVMSDLTKGKDIIEEAVGINLKWFRPPYGVLSMGTVVAARRLGLTTVLWSTWGRDWRGAATAQTVYEDVWKGIGDGGTVLLHDSDCTSAPEAWRSALGALPMIVGGVRQRGWSIGPLAEHSPIHA